MRSGRRNMVWWEWLPTIETRKRFDAKPEDCVADGRAALRWIQDHAAELGIDPSKIVVQGSSAGGHVAAWTAIPDPVMPRDGL